jgi:hypothetical protein
MLHAYVTRFDVTRNQKFFTNFFGTKQGLNLSTLIIEKKIIV